MPHKALDILKYKPPWPLGLQDTFHIEKQCPSRIGKTFPFPGSTECLAREAGAQYVEIRYCRPVNLSDVTMYLFSRMVLSEHGYSIRLYLGCKYTHRSMTCIGTCQLQAFTYAANTGKKVYKSNVHRFLCVSIQYAKVRKIAVSAVRWCI